MPNTKKKPFGRHLIFKSGIHTNEGQQVWPPDRVRGVLDATRRLSPPLIPYTLLHPEDNLPIFGFAERESITLHDLGDGSVTLSAIPLKFAEETIPALLRGGLNKVSIGLGTDDQIVHIGLVPKPAVDGLGTVFCENPVPASSKAVVVFESKDLDNPVKTAFGSPLGMRVGWMFRDLASWMQRQRDRAIEKDGVETADKFMPQYLIDSLKEPIPDDEPVLRDLRSDSVPANSFSNSNDDDMTEEQKRKMQQLETENAQLIIEKNSALQKAAELEGGVRQREITGFLDSIADRVPGSMRGLVEGILSDLQSLKPRVFSAADGTTQEKSSYEVLRDLLSSAKPAVVFSEVATGDKAAEGADARPIDQRVSDELGSQIEAARRGAK
jgi:hypothetical protein